MGLSPYASIQNLEISINGVRKQLANVNVNKACGPDLILARILRDLAPEISQMLTFIFQQSYSTGTIPSDWSTALVTAVYKKDSKTSPVNYRPISLTCLCYKVMEHIILSHINKHLASNNIITRHQHGFRKKYVVHNPADISHS